MGITFLKVIVILHYYIYTLTDCELNYILEITTMTEGSLKFQLSGKKGCLYCL